MELQKVKMGKARMRLEKNIQLIKTPLNPYIHLLGGPYSEIVINEKLSLASFTSLSSITDMASLIEGEELNSC